MRTCLACEFHPLSVSSIPLPCVSIFLERLPIARHKILRDQDDAIRSRIIKRLRPFLHQRGLRLRIILPSYIRHARNHLDARTLRHLPLHLRGKTPRLQKSHGSLAGNPARPCATPWWRPGRGSEASRPHGKLVVAVGSERSAASICRRSCCTMKSFGPCLASCLAS